MGVYKWNGYATSENRGTYRYFNKFIVDKREKAKNRARKCRGKKKVN